MNEMKAQMSVQGNMKVKKNIKNRSRLHSIVKDKLSP